MNLGKFSLLLISVCLAAWVLPDFVDARRGGGGRGGGHRGGGGGGYRGGGDGYNRRY